MIPKDDVDQKVIKQIVMEEYLYAVNALCMGIQVKIKIQVNLFSSILAWDSINETNRHSTSTIAFAGNAL